MLLLLAAMVGLGAGGYLWLQASRHADPGEAAPTGATADVSGRYLPHASVWPFAIGLGAVLLANGLALGLWAVVPGLLVLLGAIGGFVRQSRRRD